MGIACCALGGWQCGHVVATAESLYHNTMREMHAVANKLSENGYCQSVHIASV